MAGRQSVSNGNVMADAIGGHRRKLTTLSSQESVLTLLVIGQENAVVDYLPA